MASDREEKWQKYFSSGPVDTKIKSTGNVSVYDESGKAIDSLENGTLIHVPASTFYNKRYLIVYEKGGNQLTGYVPQENVAKPFQTKGATENLGVRAETLILGGNITTLNYHDKNIEVRAFSSADKLATSIITGLKNNKNVSSQIVEVFKDYFDKGIVIWDGVSDTEINELGKYVGEVLIGYLALKNTTDSFSKVFYPSRIKTFMVPTDPSFSGIDSFLITNKDVIVPISSKFGRGALASFFSNLLPKALNSSKVPAGELANIVSAASKAKISADTLEKKRGSKEVLYTHGINNILGIDIKEPISVYNDIVKNGKNIKNLNQETLKVINAIQAFKNVDNKITSALPFSVTSFFSRETAKRLNNDKVSKDYMLEILASKNFWQANLDITKWKTGTIYFQMIDSGKSSIVVSGGKAAIGDITASQGMLNYEVKTA